MNRKNKTVMRSAKQTAAFVLAGAVWFGLPVGGVAETAQAAQPAKKAVKSPEQLTVTRRKGNKIRVSWKKMRDIKKAKIQAYLKTGNGPYRKIGTTAGTGLTTKKLKYNTAYRVRVRAVSGRKGSPYVYSKNTIVFLKRPSGVKLQKISGNRLKISWRQISRTGAAKNAKIQVYLKCGNGKAKKISVTKGKTVTTEPLKKSGIYRAAVRAVTGKNYSAFSHYSAAVRINADKADRIQDAEKKKPTVSLVREKQTGLVNMKWAQYAVVTFDQGYSLDNSRILVDGTDVSEAVTKVTDDGSIVKWEITSLNPGKLTVQSKSDADVSETVTLSQNKKPVPPQVVKKTAPAFFLTHGPVSIYDYYLTNYDEEGNVRRRPAKTTFSLSENSERIRSYSEDAELQEDGSGTVEIMFNYSSGKDKAWFDAVAEKGALELVADSEQKTVLNSHLTYSKTVAEHNGSPVGVIRVPVGQDNFRSNGEYYIRTRSKGNKSAMTRIHVVNKKAPSILISESGKIVSGQNIHFHIKDMTEGIRESIKEVTLKDPTGQTKVLTHIDDWFHYGNTGLFVLYNDTESASGTNHTRYRGAYTLTIQAAGFKTCSKTFVVDEGLDPAAAGQKKAGTAAAGKRSQAVKTHSAKVDTVSSATGIAGGSGSSSSGGTMVSASILFDGDLLANALILDDLGVNNSSAKAIAERWQKDVIYDYAYAEDGKVFYDWTEYYNAVSDAQNAGRYLSFAEYAKTADGEKNQKPSQVKMVLEDNMLGDIMDNYAGKEAPVLTLTNGSAVKEGEDAVLTSSDADYMKAITGVYEQNRYEPIRGFQVKDGKLVIAASALQLKKGEKQSDNFFEVKADGYRTTRIQIPYEKNLEDVKLRVDTADKVSVGQDVTIRIDGSKGDFLKNLKEVRLSNGRKTRNVHTKSQSGTSGNDWYEVDSSGTALTLKAGLFQAEGSYDLTLSSEWYGDKSVSIAVKEAAEDPEAQKAPGVKSVTEQKGIYRIAFAGEDSMTEKFLNNIQSVRVGDTNYEKALLGVSASSAASYGTDCENPAYGGKRVILELTQDGFSKDQDTQVTVRVRGYQTLTFVLHADGTLAAPENPESEGKAEAPEAKAFVKQQGDGWLTNDWYYLDFGANHDEARSYLTKKLKAVTVNGITYHAAGENEYISSASGNKYKFGTGNIGNDNLLMLTAGDGLKKGGKATIVLEAEGYQTETIQIGEDGSLL